MKKLTLLIAVILIAGLLAGCGILPEKSQLDYIKADPIEVTLNLGTTLGATQKLTQRLEVTAHYEDLTYADVTSNCKYSSSNTEVTVNDEGLIEAVTFISFPSEGEATILVTYTQHNFWTGRIIRTAEVEVTVEY